MISGRERRRREHQAREQLAQAAAIKNEGWQTREIYNTTDALSILSHVARSFPKIEGCQTDALPDVTPSYDSNTRTGQKDHAQLSELSFIADDEILSVEDARVFVSFFLEKICPIYPGIPMEERSVDGLLKYPLLFGTVCMIASRYYVAYGSDEAVRSRSFEIHLKMWIWVRRSLAQHIWSSQLSQSKETVLTNLLLSEWGPVAFELRPEEIARYLAFRGTPSEEWVRKTTLRNSDRTLLLIIGNAVRLAQDAGLDTSTTSINVGLLLSEVVISSRMGRPCMLANIIREPLSSRLNYTVAQQAQAEILQIMAMANDMLYHSREHTRDLLSSGRYLSLLFMFVPHFENWMNKYTDLFKSGPSLDVMAILFGAYHIKLYTFSLALSRRGTRAEDTPIMSREGSVEPMPSQGLRTPNNAHADTKSPAQTNGAQANPPAPPLSRALTWDRQGTQFINIAVDSAKTLIGMATTFFQRGQLAFMPTRWAMYIIHAIVVLIKTLVVLPPLKTRDRASETLALTRQAAQILVNSGPDNYHVCRLYGAVLVSLCAHLTREISRSQEASRAATPSFQYPNDQHAPNSMHAENGGTESDAASSSSAAPTASTPYSPHDVKCSPDTFPPSPMPPAVALRGHAPGQGTMAQGVGTPLPNPSQANASQRPPLQQTHLSTHTQQHQHHMHQGDFQHPQPPMAQEGPNGPVPMMAGGERPTDAPIGSNGQGVPSASANQQLPSQQGQFVPYAQSEYQLPPDMQFGPNVDFDFMMSGGDGLGFVEPFLETISKGDFFDSY